MEYTELEPELARKYFDHLPDKDLQKIIDHISGGAQINLKEFTPGNYSQLRKEVYHYITNLLAERALLT